MKLIPLTIFFISLAVDVRPQKYRQDFSFPPQYQTPNVGIFTSDSSLYLPPESHTALPFFMKNMNNLQYPLLPPTGTKAPAIYPTPYPLIISSSIVPNFDDDDDDEDNGRINLSTSSPPKPQPPRTNQTERNPEQMKDKREMRPIPKMMYQQTIPIQNRNDAKFSFKMPALAPSVAVTTPAPSNPTPAVRRMIIGPENQRSDFDQVKAPSYIQGPQFLPAGQGIYVSSSTEPAIPILRLSNEMDLDGSFSYEALGADQTHYVQHSRMENMGTDKQEQVVEGSYSYVGDNGQTYTVHYVADANGFRASGDHLPVAPPVPEIIQRAVQYNLAEEAKKPPHLRLWQDDGSYNEARDSDKNQNNNQQQQQQQFSLPPTRNLFTGRTPEAFSYSFSQGSNTGNNLVVAASNQAPIKTIDFTTEPPKANSAPISPQITFLASQGAHLPSINTIQNQISRMFTTDKPALPQIVNYEAQIKEADQEPNKGLWRWQYGINANNLSQNPNKETISRSFGEGDDIMINFGDMTPDQYTKMIRSQLEYSPENSVMNQFTQNLQDNENQQNFKNNNNVQRNYQYSQNIQNNDKPQSQTLDNQQNQNHYQISQRQDNQIYQKLDNNLKQNNNTNNGNSQNHEIKFNQELENSQNQNNHKYDESKQHQESQFYQNLGNNHNQNYYKYNENSEHQYNNNQNNPDYYQRQQTNTETETQNFNAKELSVVRESNNNYYSPSTAPTLPQSEDWNIATPSAYQVQSTMKSLDSRNFMPDTPKLLTHKDFMFPATQTITQSYDFDENTFYEPRKIKALNTELNSRPVGNTVNEMQNIFVKSVSSSDHWTKESSEIKESTTQEPYVNTVRDLKFTDFIVQESKNDFKPISTTTTEIPRQETTTESIVEDIIQNNIFLKNLFSPQKSEKQEKNSYGTEKYYKENKVIEEPKKIVHAKEGAEPKNDKIHKIIPYQQKPSNEIKLYKKKPMDIADILNYVSIKNHFESSKVNSNGRITDSNFDQRNELRFIPIQREREGNEASIPEQKNNSRLTDTDRSEELRGLIKNYKVLQRNNHNMKYDNRPLKTELSPPPLKSVSLPPLGRAGPSMKSYLPPIFV